MIPGSSKPALHTPPDIQRVTLKLIMVKDVVQCRRKSVRLTDDLLRDLQGYQPHAVLFR